MRTINPTGLAEIREFLAEHHTLEMTDDMIGAWASEAEESLAAGNPAMIEVDGFHSVSRHPVTFTVSSAGIDDDERLLNAIDRSILNGESVRIEVDNIDDATSALLDLCDDYDSFGDAPEQDGSVKCWGMYQGDEFMIHLVQER